MRINGIGTASMLIAVLAAAVGFQRDRPATNVGAPAAQQFPLSPRCATEIFEAAEEEDI